jgi:hypothetical protein
MAMTKESENQCTIMAKGKHQRIEINVYVSNGENNGENIIIISISKAKILAACGWLWRLAGWLAWQLAHASLAVAAWLSLSL